MSLPTFEQRLDAYCTWAEKEYGEVYFHDAGYEPGPVEFYGVVDDKDENISPCFDEADVISDTEDPYFDVRIIRPGSDEFSDLLFFFPEDLEQVIAFARKRRLTGREYLANLIGKLRDEEYVLEWEAV